MTNLTTLSNMTKTMSSLELVDIINKVRKEENPDNATLEHADFLKKIKKVLGEEVAGNFSGYYIAENGKQNPCYNLPKRESILMVMSESYKVQAAVYDRMEELEQVTQTLADRAGVPKQVLIQDAKDNALLAKLQASIDASKAKSLLTHMKVEAAKEKYAEQSRILRAKTTKLLAQGAKVKGDMTASKLDMPTDTITNLLKEHGSSIEPKLANWALRQLGYLTKTNEVTDTGHYYGRNIKSSPRSKTTLARWFNSEFANLLEQIERIIEDLVNN